MVTICNKDIPNELNELTIQQFEDITEIHANPKLDNVEKHLEVFKYMGVQEAEDMEFEDFKEAIRLFNTAKAPEGILLKRFEADGYTYQAYDLCAKLTARLNAEGTTAEIYQQYTEWMAKRYPILQVARILGEKKSIVYTFEPIGGSFDAALKFRGF